MRASPPLIVLAGLGIAAAGFAGTAGSGSPYWSTSDLNGWVLLFAVGLGLALGAFPFASQGYLRDHHPRRADNWDVSMVMWLGAGGLVLAAGVVLGVAGHFSADSLAGVLGWCAMIEGGLVTVAVLVVLIEG